MVFPAISYWHVRRSLGHGPHSPLRDAIALNSAQRDHTDHGNSMEINYLSSVKNPYDIPLCWLVNRDPYKGLF